MPEIITKAPPPPLLPSCESYPPPASELKMRLPFGLNIQAIRRSFVQYADADDMISQFLAQIQPALSPFMSVLVLAALAKAFYDFSKSVKEAVSSLSPDPIIEAIEKIVVLLPKLLEFIPPLNYIPPIIDITVLVLDLLDVAITSLLRVLETEILKQAFIQAAETNETLEYFTECIDALVDAQKDGFASSIVAAAPIFCILAQLLDLIDIEELREFIEPLREIVGLLSGVTADNVNPLLADVLRDVQDLLREIRAALEPFIGSVKNAC
jgi:hypothetical protein